MTSVALFTANISGLCSEILGGDHDRPSSVTRQGSILNFPAALLDVMLTTPRLRSIPSPYMLRRALQRTPTPSSSRNASTFMPTSKTQSSTSKIRPAAPASVRRLDQVTRHLSTSSASMSVDEQKAKVLEAFEAHSTWSWPTSGGGLNPKSEDPRLQEPPVLFEDVFAAKVFTLNRPKAANALSLDMIRMLRRKVIEVSGNTTRLSYERMRENSCIPQLSFLPEGVWISEDANAFPCSSI